MSTGTTPAKDWKKNQGTPEKVIPKSYHNKEEFITHATLVFFKPGFLMTRTKAGQELTLDEFLEDLQSLKKPAYKHSQSIRAFATEIHAYAKGLMGEMEKTGFHVLGEEPDFSDVVPGKDHTVFFEYVLRKELEQLVHKDLTNRDRVMSIASRNNKDTEHYGLGMSHLDIIKERYPDLYDDHVQTLAPYIQKADDYLRDINPDDYITPKWMSQLISDAKIVGVAPPANEASANLS